MSGQSSSSACELNVVAANSRDAMGARAAAEIAKEIRSCLDRQNSARMIFAAAPSQGEMLAALRNQTDIDWSRVTAFHMDEYIGLSPDAPQRFGLWLRLWLFDHLPFRSINLLDPGNDPAKAAAEYAAKLNAAPIDIVCCGIGSNGHLAFNEPPADFDDAETVKIVELEARCSQQQVDEKCFDNLEDVPTHALTVTIPALLAARALFCIVPGAHKNEAVRRTLHDPISPPRARPVRCAYMRASTCISTLSPRPESAVMTAEVLHRRFGACGRDLYLLNRS